MMKHKCITDNSTYFSKVTVQACLFFVVSSPVSRIFDTNDCINLMLKIKYNECNKTCLHVCSMFVYVDKQEVPLIMRQHPGFSSLTSLYSITCDFVHVLLIIFLCVQSPHLFSTFIFNLIIW